MLYLLGKALQHLLLGPLREMEAMKVCTCLYVCVHVIVCVCLEYVSMNLHETALQRALPSASCPIFL